MSIVVALMIGIVIGLVLYNLYLAISYWNIRR